MIAPASEPYVRSYELEKLVYSENSAESASQRTTPTIDARRHPRQFRGVAVRRERSRRSRRRAGSRRRRSASAGRSRATVNALPEVGALRDRVAERPAEDDQDEDDRRDEAGENDEREREQSRSSRTGRVSSRSLGAVDRLDHRAVAPLAAQSAPTHADGEGDRRAGLVVGRALLRQIDHVEDALRRDRAEQVRSASRRRPGRSARAGRRPGSRSGRTRAASCTRSPARDRGSRRRGTPCPRP